MSIRLNKSSFIVRTAMLLFTVLTTTGTWAQTQLNEGFEGPTFVPEDWMAIHVSGDKSWERTKEFHRYGSYGAYMDSSKGGNENYLITPQLKPAKTGLYNERLFFSVAAQHWTGTTLRIEVSTTDTKPSSFTPIQTYTTGSPDGNSTNINSTHLNDWREKGVTIPDEYIGKPIYIAFHVIDNNGSGIVIDSVYGVSLYISPYSKPQNLSCSNVTSNSVDLSWSAGDSETSWQVVCLNDGNEEFNKTLPTTSCTISGLTPGSNYSVKVRGNYDNDHYSNWSTIRFNTLPLQLFEASDNSDILRSYNGKKVGVILTERTLYKDGKWNTLCLPFGLTDYQVSKQLAPAELMTLSSSTFTGGTLTLNFSNASEIKAGKPYIIRWNKADNYEDTNEFNLYEPTFRDVTINNNPTDDEDIETEFANFVGTFSPTDIYNEEKSNLYLGSDNVLYYPWGDNMTSFTINSFRAYFQLNQGIVGGEPSSTVGVNKFVLNFDGKASSVIDIEHSPLNIEHEGWYTIDGRKLNGKPTQKGIYIHNGKKVGL